MSGHSKFANIKHRKGKNDLAKAKIFTKFSREITSAVKSSGKDIETNARLRDIVYKARANNMPNENIERVIKKASGEKTSDNFEAITYEGYGPSGISVIVTTLTDNRNRTAGNVRNAFTKGGGNMGTTGSVTFMFEQKGIILVEKKYDEEMLMDLCISNGALDFEVTDEFYEITTEFHDFTNILIVLEKNNIEVYQSMSGYFPDNYISLEDEEDIKKMNKILTLLEDDDDVQDVYHNWNL